jgi:hypothetical protein
VLTVPPEQGRRSVEVRDNSLPLISALALLSVNRR